MQYEITEEDFRVIRASCAVAYMSLAEETKGVVSPEMGMIRDACNRLEEQHDALSTETEVQSTED